MPNSTGETKGVTYNALFNQWNAVLLPSEKANKAKKILFHIGHRIIKILSISKESIIRCYSTNRQLKYYHTYSSSTLIQRQHHWLDSFFCTNISKTA